MRSEFRRRLISLLFLIVSARCARPQFFKKGDYERVSQSLMQGMA